LTKEIRTRRFNGYGFLLSQKRKSVVRTVPPFLLSHFLRMKRFDHPRDLINVEVSDFGQPLRFSGSLRHAACGQAPLPLNLFVRSAWQAPYTPTGRFSRYSLGSNTSASVPYCFTHLRKASVPLVVTVIRSEPSARLISSARLEKCCSSTYPERSEPGM
jgi:hypothetical protein